LDQPVGPISHGENGVLLIIAPPHFAPVGVIEITGTTRFSLSDIQWNGLLNAISNAGWNNRTWRLNENRQQTSQ